MRQVLGVNVSCYVLGVRCYGVSVLCVKCSLLVLVLVRVWC